MKVFKLLQWIIGNREAKSYPADLRDKDLDLSLCNEIRQKVLCRPDTINILQPLSRTRFVVFDTETTGFDPCNGDRIIALGAVTLANGKLNRDDYFDRLVKPFRSVPKTISELTGINNEMLEDANDFFRVFNDFLDFLKDGVLVAHNASFDISFINWRLKACQAKLNCPVVDTLRISYSLEPTLKNHSLDNLVWIYKIPSARRHTALGDAIMTAELLEKFLFRLRKQHITTLLDLFNHLHWQFYR